MGVWHERGPSPWSVPRQRPRGWLKPGERTQRWLRRTPAVPPSRPAVPTGGRGQGRSLGAQRRPGFRARRTPPRIHCLREDFLDYSPPPLLVDLDPAQFTENSSEPFCGRASPSPKAGPQKQWGAGPRVTCALESPASWFLCLKSAPRKHLPQRSSYSAGQGLQAVPAASRRSNTSAKNGRGRPSVL